MIMICIDSATTNILTKIMSTIPSSTTDTEYQSNNFTEIIATAVSMTILSIVLIITLVAIIWSYKRRSAKKCELYDDSSYSTLNRRPGQVQLHSIQQNSAELYDQIHLSPFTGQTEFITKPQSENINNPFYNSHPTNPDTENSMASVESQANSPLAIYAAIDNSKRKKVKKDDTKHTAAEKYTQKVSSSKGVHNMEGEGQFKNWCQIYMHVSDHHAGPRQSEQR